MTCSVIRHVNWTIDPDLESDAEPITHVMQCAVCGEQSETTEDFETARSWVGAHAGCNPTHHTYREIIHRPWRAVMGPT